MDLHERRHRIGVAGALAAVFLAAAYFGLSFIYAEGYGLIYEIAYALVLLVAVAIVFDRLFIR